MVENNSPHLLFDGLYKIASNDVSDDEEVVAEIDDLDDYEVDNPPTWQYFRFYPSPQNLVMWTNSSGTPLQVARWLNIFNLDIDHGTYTLRGKNLGITIIKTKESAKIRYRATIDFNRLLVETVHPSAVILPYNPTQFCFIPIPDIDHFYVTSLKEKIRHNLPLDRFDMCSRAVVYLRMFFDELMAYCNQFPTPVGLQVMTLLKTETPVKGEKFDILL